MVIVMIQIVMVIVMMMVTVSDCHGDNCHGDNDNYYCVYDYDDADMTNTLMSMIITLINPSHLFKQVYWNTCARLILIL